MQALQFVKPLLLRSSSFALIALGLAHCLRHVGYTIDDAYITFRYARNLVHGLGLVYNAGDYVKGYSNTLVTLLSTIPALFSADPAPFVKAVSLALYVVMMRTLSVRCSDRASALVTLGCIAVSAPVAVWFSAGLETGIHTALIVSAVVRRLSEQEKGGGTGSGLLFSLVVLSRPEGVLFWTVAVVHDLLFRKKLRPVARPDVVFFLLPPLVAASELLVSQLYYGSALPQTYYAKVASTFSLASVVQQMWAGPIAQLSDGDHYLLRSFRLTFGHLTLPFFGAALLAFSNRARVRDNALHLLVIAVQVGFIGLARNDWMPAGRFLVPLLPSLAVLVGEGVAVLGRGPRVLRWAQWPVALLAVGALVPINFATSQTVRSERRLNAASKLANGRAYTRLVAPGATLSTFDIGGQGYAAASFEIIDTDGLTDRRLAACGAQPAACVRYGEITQPELIRKHPSGKGGFVAGAVVHDRYVTLGYQGEVRIARSEYLKDAPPSTATALTAEFTSHLRLVAISTPRYVRVAKELRLDLYWRKKKANASPACDRSVELRDASGEVRARGTDWIWCFADGRRAWRSGLFNDHVVFDPISASGGLDIWVRQDGHEALVGRIDVLEPAAAESKALELLRVAVDDSTVAGRFQLLDQANALSERHFVRAAYQRASIAHARSLLPVGLEHLPEEEQLRALKRQRRVLLRTAWDVPLVSRDLRRAIDENAARRHALIDSVISP